ncbi:hybrid sensor histidine kinase/response regulator [Saccharibacillus qingshengii]|uniref:hybrid sensor histidine kinase/response regulator n=1 Tax=Saccharibacillus qingshengii TaxID=1763540 RepID=UPI0015535FFE|nr:ATP-binding protein [Saccharibacillus qingshengii]
MRTFTRQTSKKTFRLRPRISVFLLLLLLLVILAGLRLLLTNPYSLQNPPRASQGVLDLRQTTLDRWHTIPLDGEWEFYPGQFIQSDPPDTKKAAYLRVPGSWQAGFGADQDLAKGYGSYRLRILTDPAQAQSYKLMIKDIQTAFRLYANGEIEAQLGTPAQTEEAHVANVKSDLVPLPETSEIELIVEVSNFENARRGGIARSIKFGSTNAINSERTYNVGMQLITLSILLLHALYVGMIYWFSGKNKFFLLFTLLLAAAVLGISLDEDKILLSIWPFDYAAAKKISLFSYTAMMTLMLKLAVSFSLEPARQRKYRYYFVPAAVYAIFIVVAPIEAVLYSAKIGVFSAATLFPSLWVPVLLVRYVLEKDRNAVFLLVAAAGMASTLLWGGFKNAGWVEPGFYAFDILLAFLGTVAYAVGRYFRINADLADLAQRLQKADRTKDDFLANTSHELRTPLHGMINMADSVLAAEGDALSERSRKDLQLLGQVGRRMGLLLGDLLDVSQIRENRLSVYPEAVKVQSTAAGVMDMLRYMTVGKPLELQLSIPDDFPSVYADEKRLTQILFNLLHNAIKFTASGTVKVSAELAEDPADGLRAVISVSDTGNGITAAELTRIFAPYEQGDPLQNAAGIGLGLSISRSLAELHGGELGAKSEPGQGSIFFFSLPLAEVSAWENGLQSEQIFDASRLGTAEDRQKSDKVQVPAYSVEERFPDVSNEDPAWLREDLTDSDRRPQILAVDDDPVNLRVLRSMLPEERYRVTSVLSGAEALERLENRTWDLVIADVMMPQMSGYELASRIRDRYSRAELPILLLTARSRPEDIYAGFAAGASDYLSKPADALELNYRVKALTDLKHAVSERLSLEAAYLQAQIQPHFLFNALNSITALSGIDIDKMNETIEAFGSYLKISFDYWSARPLVPLERELELVRSYLYIETMRFEDRLRVEVEIADDIDPDLLLPPLCIQPLVENAVRHGVLSRSKGGCVSLRAEAVDGDIVFTVTDDGIGMDDETLGSLLIPVRSGRQGIGTLNTDRRLKRLYGSGLSIRSRLGEGTTVSFRIPEGGYPPEQSGLASD